MRWPVVLALLLLCLVLTAEAKKKKPAKPAKKPAKKPKCPMDSINTKRFADWTVTTTNNKGVVKPTADQPCWFNLRKSNCGKCKNDGQQCGFPMHKWCQNPKSKTGCPGIPKYKTTNSTIGYPCFWDPNDMSCPWCKTGNTFAQCKDSSVSEKCGRYCSKTKDQKCDGVPSHCGRIPKCGLKAKCLKVGNSEIKKCQCNAGWEGNGFQCYSTETGLLATNPTDQVEMSIETDSKFWVYPQGSPELFPEL